MRVQVLLLQTSPSTFDCYARHPSMIRQNSRHLTSRDHQRPQGEIPLKSTKCLASLPNNTLGCVYKALFICDFPIHDVLEDVKALGRILFSPPLKPSTETIVNHGETSLPNEALQQTTFLEQWQEVVDTFSGNLYFPNGSLKLTTVHKLADAGLAFSTLQGIYSIFGIDGLYGVIGLLPSTRNSQPRQNTSAKSPRISSNKRIIISILHYFHEP